MCQYWCYVLDIPNLFSFHRHIRAQYSAFKTLFVLFFYLHVIMHRDKFLIIKPTRCTNLSNLYWKETLRVSDSSSVHHQEFFTVHTALVCVIQVCCVYSGKTTDDGQRNCPKHVVSFQNKFDKLVHPIGFIVRNCL